MNEQEDLEREDLLRSIAALTEDARLRRGEGDASWAMQQYELVVSKLRANRQRYGFLDGRLQDGLAGAHYGIARCLRALDHQTDALRQLNKSISIRSEIKKYGERKLKSGIGQRTAIALCERAELLELEGEHCREQAILAYKRAFELFERERKDERLGETAFYRYADAVLRVVQLLQDEAPGEALVVLETFLGTRRETGIAVKNNEVVSKLDQHRLCLELTCKSSALQRNLFVARIMFLPIVALLIFSWIWLSADSLAGWQAALLIQLPIVIYSWSLGFSEHQRKNTLGIVVVGPLLCSLLQLSSVPHAALCIASGMCGWLLIAFLSKTAWFRQWREKKLLVAERYRGDSALAEHVGRLLPQLISWLVVEDDEGKQVLRPLVCSLLAEVEVVGDGLNTLCWKLLTSLAVEFVAAILANHYPLATGPRRPERNLHQPWAGGRIFYALLPRGIHAFA